MATLPKKRIQVMNTSFRDGFQSVYGARVLTADFLPAVEAARDAGITYFEAGGGARFQTLYFYCNEDAFAMMDAFRRAAGPDANLQTLSRGINVVGLDSQSSDIIRLHAQLFKKHGMTTIRNFDALNDVNNLVFSGKCIAEAGLRHEVVISLMALPPGCEGAHTPEFYLGILKGILKAEIPYHSVCFKDASGTTTPQVVFETIQGARRMLGDETHIRFHTHDTAGTGVICYKAAIEAGADGIDLAMAPVSGGTSQPDYASVWHALRGTAWDLDCDIDRVMRAAEVFKDCMKDYFTPPEAKMVEPLIPWSPMPGGALTANTQMMRDHGIMDKYPEIIAAMSETVRLGGFGTSVTPVSQFYFQQAFNNVVFGPWKKFAEGYGKMVLGYFGKTPVPPDPKIVELASKDLGLPPTTRDPLEMNDENPKKGAAAARKKLEEAGLPITDENIFIAATCLEKGIAFLKGEATLNVRKVKKDEPKPAEAAAAPAPAPAAAPEPSGPARYRVTVNGHLYSVEVASETDVTVNGRAIAVGASAPSAAPAPVPSAAAAPAAEGEAVTAPLAGTVFKIRVAEGQDVAAAQTLIVLESMKMEIEVKSPRAGRVGAIAVREGEKVPSGKALLTLR